MQERRATGWHVATVTELRSAVSRYYRNKLRPRNPTAHTYLPSRSPSAILRRLPTPPPPHRRRRAYSSSYELTCCLCSSETASGEAGVTLTLIAATASISVLFEAFLILCSLVSHRAPSESIKRRSKSLLLALALLGQSHRRRWRWSRRVPEWIDSCLRKIGNGKRLIKNFRFRDIIII